WRWPDEKTTKSTNSISELLHIESCGGGGFLRTAAVLTRTQVGRVPIPPVMFGVRLLVVVVVLGRFAEEFCKPRDVHGSCSLLLPFASGKARLDLAQTSGCGIVLKSRPKGASKHRNSPPGLQATHPD